MTSKKEILEELGERVRNCFNAKGMCRKCGEQGFFSLEERKAHLRDNRSCAEYARVKKAELVAEPEASPARGPAEGEGASSPRDILDNPILQADRFGQGIKNGKLYYGVPVANDRGEQIFAVFYDGKLLYGKEMLEALGFRFEEDALLCGDTWKRGGEDSLKEYALLLGQGKPREPSSTRELLERIIALNKKHIYHYLGEGAHIIIAAYALQSYLFTAFPACARLLVLGLENSGKSKQCDLLAAVSCNPINSPDISRSATFRTLEARAGMLIIDNFDKRNDVEKEELVKIYDTSYEDGRPIYKIEEYGGRKRKPKPFRTFCPMVVNGQDTSWIPRSSISRTIFLPMERNTKARLVPFEKANKKEIAAICNEARIWALHYCKVLPKTAEALELSFSNREEDISRPILAILKDAGEEYLKKGLDFLTKNYEENHDEDEFSDASIYLTLLWDYAKKEHKPGAGSVVRVFVSELARSVVGEKGIREFFGQDRKNPFYEKELLKEAKALSPFLRGIPNVGTGKTDNRRRYDYNIIDLARFMKGRRIEVGKEGEELLQGKLTEPEAEPEASPVKTSPEGEAGGEEAEK